LPEDRDVTDPYTWQPNEGGYEVFWAKTIMMAEAEGLEFVWARRTGSGFEDGSLMAITYSEPNQLDIRLYMGLPNAILREGEEEELDFILSEFDFFEAMAKSSRIDPSP
jgi:hypothetical protein